MPAKRSEVVRVDGRIGKSERITGSFTTSENTQQAYDYWETKILSDDDDVAVVRVASDPNGRPTIPLPPRGERVSLVCEARAVSGNVRLTVQSVDLGTFEDHAAAALVA